MEDQCGFFDELGKQCPNKAAANSNFCTTHGLLQQRSRNTKPAENGFTSGRASKAEWSRRTAYIDTGKKSNTNF